MKNILIAAMSMMLVTAFAGAASAQGYVAPPNRYSPPPQDYKLPPGQTCPDGWRESAGWCLCVKHVTFYNPPPPYNVVVNAPGAHVYGNPLYIPAGRIDVKGPPIYVDAPPVHIAGPDIYLHRPEIWVRPSPVTVEPPKIHIEDCKPGEKCEPVPTTGYVDP